MNTVQERKPPIGRLDLSRSGMTLRILVSRLRGKFLRVVGLWVWVDPQGIYLNSCGCLPPSGVPCELPFLGCFGAYFAVKGRGLKTVFQADLRGKMSAPCQFIPMNNSNGGFIYGDVSKIFVPKAIIFD